MDEKMDEQKERDPVPFVISLFAITLAAAALFVSFVGICTKNAGDNRNAIRDNEEIRKSVKEEIEKLLNLSPRRTGMPLTTKSGNESFVITSLRALSSVQEQYRTRFATYGSLANLSALSYIDSVFGSGNKNGYYFRMTAYADTWNCTAVPITVGTTGDRGFRIDQSGVIRFTSDGSAPTASSSPRDD